MSDTTNDGGPAFPVVCDDARDTAGLVAAGYGGLSKREWFAGMAPEPSKEDVDEVMNRERMANPNNEDNRPPIHSREEIICMLRYKRADALLAEGRKGGTK